MSWGVSGRFLADELLEAGEGESDPSAAGAVNQAFVQESGSDGG